MELLTKMNELVWGIPTLILILGLGIYLTVATRAVQFRKFIPAMRHFGKSLISSTDKGGVSSYRALCTALAATVGTGNLAGVAGAIAIGGPGAVFWMWICGFLGMVIKYTEAALAVKYRVPVSGGGYTGGPMYMIKLGMKKYHFLAGVYCFFGVVATFGVGNATQINTVVQGLQSTVHSFGWNIPWLAPVTGVAVAVITVILFLGGASRIGKLAEVLVPAAAFAYILLCTVALVIYGDKIPQAFEQIVVGAFSPRSVTGGMVGSFLTTLRIGVSRGIFTNEAGMGTAAIAHAGAQIRHPWEQGYMGIVEVFLDTIVICTMTALVILCVQPPVMYGNDPGINLTLQAFQTVFGNWIQIPITLFLCLFAFATILGWGLYGGRCAQYLFGDRVWKKFVFLQGFAVAVSAILECSTVWTVSEIVNGCMAIPNLIALWFLRNDIISISKKLPGRTAKEAACRAGKAEIMTR